jgi:hypothetical protein
VLDVAVREPPVANRVYFDGFSFLKQLGVGATELGTEARGEAGARH